MGKMALVFAAGACALAAHGGGRADWMRGSFGISVHWTANCACADGARISFEEAVRDFDAERFAETLSEAGARHCIFTVTHALQKMPCPNAALDRIAPGYTSRRDMLADVSAALRRRGIRLIAYYNHSCNDRSAPVLEWKRKCGYPCDGDGNGSMEIFATNYCAIVEDISRRHGAGIAGWWFDSPYSVDSSGPHKNVKGEWHFPWASLIAAARSGNPSAAVAINAGIGEHFLYAPDTDFHAGESVKFDETFRPDPHPGLVDHRWICADSTKWVFSKKLVEAGGFVPLRLPARDLAAYARRHTALGRMVTFNVLIDLRGNFNPAIHELARAMRDSQGQSSK